MSNGLFAWAANAARHAWNAETVEIAERNPWISLRALRTLRLNVVFSVESVDSLPATVDNQGEMFLAAASLVLISVGINLPTVTG